MSREAGKPPETFPYNGKQLTVAQLAKEVDMPVTTLRSRLWLFDQEDRTETVRMAIERPYKARKRQRVGIPTSEGRSLVIRCWKAPGRRK